MSSNKNANDARKQTGSPVDGAQRKPPKAWSQGTNPITQRPSNPSTTNGTANSVKPSQHQPAPTSDSGSPMRHLNDRMMFLLASLTGLPGHITLKNGEKYTGVLSGTSLDPTEMRYVFKMVKRVQGSDAQVNGTSEPSDDYVGQGENHVMSFDIGDVADFNVSNVILNKSQSRTQNGASTGFRTDTDISGHMSMKERTLQKWEPSTDSNADFSLESSGSTGWDQFATNEKLFGVTSNYDENIYTTTINYNDPAYAQKHARASKLASEIEGSSSTNAHVREERGLTSADDKGLDEEEKYSGVHRNFPPLPTGQPNKYTPPARRPPTGQPTVPGAPVDPAIISSQLARPDSAAAKSAQRTATPPTEKRPQPESSKADTVTNVEASTASPAPIPIPADKVEPAQGAELNPKPTPTPKATTADQAHRINTTLPSVTVARRPGRPENATATVEHDLLDSFKQFATQEKLRVSERQRTIARENKAVKLNDLKKFSLNFKLNTPVPTDLVPILAKDEGKQKLIVDKALRAVQESKTTPSKPTPGPAEVKPPTSRTASSSKPESTHASPSAPVDRQQGQRPRPSPNAPNTYGSSSLRGPAQNSNQNPPRNTGMLGQRLVNNQAQHKQGGLPYPPIPHPIPSADGRPQPPSGPGTSSGGHTPTLNVGAREFKPNPAAMNFQPSGPSNQSSPRPESAPKQDQAPRKQKVVPFWSESDPKPVIDDLDLGTSFNPLKRLMSRSKEEKENLDFSKNGGVPFPFRTLPTWTTKNEKTYEQMFEPPAIPPPISAPNAMMGHVSMHHQQLPLQLQGPPNGPQHQGPHHTSRHPGVQQHHGQGHHPFDGQQGHPMQFSHSASSMHPSPRAGPPYMYGAQPQGMPGFSQGPMHNYNMSPNIQHVALQQQRGPQFVQGPMPVMGGHMMTNQPSNGPFMGMQPNPQMQMYSPNPGHAYPHYPNQMPGPPVTNGYPSPRPGGAPLMHHQGSQQGHQQQQNVVYVPQGGQPPMFAQMPPGTMTHMRGPYPQQHQGPHYGSPHQHPQFPQQAHRGTPSGSYAQPMVQQHSMQPQGPPPPTGPASHGPEASEEAK
ncbi:hypothetical protein BU24DRAFT_337600 [Aaosphaeria arxii CBS 175.79]|uniref:LsmAD domain-containing protein n=1 Tax=Aaosphaeria arxii CBS 175.79 TaxID=1450172 RepID=A0A6A5Y7F4_9PLEO|nr:uncharacterized protein BU24DRAFT_337600 [Aaosphaeria arxii CBS 175.79]KAF2021495.1 hypothetical protein BU24DRAFT_337600 [Aaosphaeria arxii CBS 175.79]